MSLIRPLVIAGPTHLNFSAEMDSSSRGCLASSFLSSFFLFFFLWADRSAVKQILMIRSSDSILIIYGLTLRVESKDSPCNSGWSLSYAMCRACRSVEG